MSQQDTLQTTQTQGVNLTPKQLQVIEFIARFVGQHGYFPRYEDIAQGLDIKSKSNVARYMRLLEDKGLIVRGDCQRATRLVWNGDGDETTGP